MRRYVERKMPGVAVSALINENTDSMALSDLIQEWMETFEKFEKEEDQLKDYIAERLLQADPENKIQYEYILHKILEIDFYQDRIIEKIISAAKTIFRRNRESNNILKPFEIYTKERMRKRMEQIKSNPKLLSLWSQEVKEEEKEKEKSLASARL